MTDKEKIRQLQLKITALERTNNDLDYLLNSGRNKFEHERNKRLKELEAQLNNPFKNQQLTLQKLLLEEINNVELLEELESRIMNKEIRLLAVSKDGSRVINDLNKVNCVL